MKEPRPDSASGGDNDSRQVEARKILFEMGLIDASFEQDKEADFVSELCDRFAEYGPRTFVSSKQLFWLRDLKEKYL